MANVPTKLMIAASLLVLGACVKKPPEALPEPPVGTAGTETAPTDPVTNAVVPGSREDFLAKVSSDKIYFDTDQSDVDAQDQATLGSQAAWLKQYPSVRVTIEGHADERGTRDYNLALGDRRANAAKNYLATLGISPARMSVISYGKERPEAVGSDEESWAKNRRAVTVTVGPDNRIDFVN
jgi:peptidoglycan-associated lipoprotein